VNSICKHGNFATIHTKEFVCFKSCKIGWNGV
jgi:hypothetical protein